MVELEPKIITAYCYNTRKGRGSSVLYDHYDSIEDLGERKLLKIESINVVGFNSQQAANAFISQNIWAYMKVEIGKCTNIFYEDQEQTIISGLMRSYSITIHLDALNDVQKLDYLEKVSETLNILS